MARRGRKPKTIKKEDAIKDFTNSKSWNKYVKKYAKQSNISEKEAADDLKVLLDVNTSRKTFSGKKEATKELTEVLDDQVLSKAEKDWKKVKAEAKSNLTFDYDFRKLNKKQPKKVDFENDKALNPEDLTSTINATEVKVNGYYDLDNGMVILLLRVTGEYGSPITTSVLATADILQKLQ